MNIKKRDEIDHMPVVPDIKDFDASSGSVLERMIFNYRYVGISLCLLITLFLGYQASKLVLNASFEKMLPQSHPYIKNFLDPRVTPILKTSLRTKPRYGGWETRSVSR